MLPLFSYYRPPHFAVLYFAAPYFAATPPPPPKLQSLTPSLTQRDWKSSSSRKGMHKNRFWESRHIWPNRATIFAFHLRILHVLSFYSLLLVRALDTYSAYSIVVVCAARNPSWKILPKHTPYWLLHLFAISWPALLCFGRMMENYIPDPKNNPINIGLAPK